MRYNKFYILSPSFRTEEAAKYLEATKLQTSNGYSEEFTVMEDLMGLAIGWNLLESQQNSL